MIECAVCHEEIKHTHYIRISSMRLEGDVAEESKDFGSVGCFLRFAEDVALGEVLAQAAEAIKDIIEKDGKDEPPPFPLMSV